MDTAFCKEIAIPVYCTALGVVHSASMLRFEAFTLDILVDLDISTKKPWKH